MVTNETVDLPDMLTDTDYLASEIHQVRSDIKEMATNNQVNDVEQNKKLMEISNKLDLIEKSISKENSKKEYKPADSQKEQESDMPVPQCEKEFVLKHVFKDVMNFKEGVQNDSEKEEHFNVNWYISVKRLNNHLGIHVFCQPIAPAAKWSIQTKLELKVVGSNQNDVIKTMDCCYEESQGCGFSDFLEWEELKKEYLVNGNLTVEAKATIIETNGFEKEKIRVFDESQKDVSDVILVVRDTKFYVLKAYLASQSSFFKSLFMKTPNKSEVPLTGIDPNDFHCFLEVLYGEFAIDDSNVEGVLLLADHIDSPMVKRRCEVFLLKESKKTFKKKQQMANCYNLQNWNFTCAIANANSKIKQFTMKNVFKNVISTGRDIISCSEKKEYFNVNWFIKVQNLNNHLGVFIHCEPISPKDKWSIQTNLELKVVGKTEATVTQDHCYELNTPRSYSKFMRWEKMGNEYLVDGSLTVEAKVKIIETTELGKTRIREFDESQKDVSDVILVVNNTKFYVSKTYLAAQSIYFKAMLFGKFSESKEVELTGIDSYDFHYFLEVLYGEYAIDDSTIEGILMIADKYDTPMVVRRCQEFLLNSSKKILRKKLELANKYDLAELKVKCMSEIKTIANIRAVWDVNEMDPLITADLLEKSLSLQQCVAQESKRETVGGMNRDFPREVRRDISRENPGPHNINYEKLTQLNSTGVYYDPNIHILYSATN